MIYLLGFSSDAQPLFNYKFATNTCEVKWEATFYHICPKSIISWHSARRSFKSVRICITWFHLYRHWLASFMDAKMRNLVLVNFFLFLFGHQVLGRYDDADAFKVEPVLFDGKSRIVRPYLVGFFFFSKEIL